MVAFAGSRCHSQRRMRADVSRPRRTLSGADSGRAPWPERRNHVPWRRDPHDAFHPAGCSVAFHCPFRNRLRQPHAGRSLPTQNGSETDELHSLARSGMKPGPLWKVSVAIAPEAEEAVVALLGDLFGQAPTVFADARTGRTSAAVFLDGRRPPPLPQRRALRAGLRRIREYGLDLGSGRVSVCQVLREDWAESWKRHFTPIEIGRRLLVRPSWSRRQAKPGQAAVVLDPGLSFGTGQHPTTRFCLEQIAAV